MIHTKPQIRQENPEELSFKTELSPIDEAKFKVWYSNTANTLQIAPNPDDPLHYYDYRGYWQENPVEILKLGDHFTDKFKVPGHPTFSEESQYSFQKGGSNIYGGKWDGKRFVHSKDTDLHAERTQEYFDQQGSGEYPVYQGNLLDMIEVYPDEYKRGGPVSSQKAKKILRHGKVYGKRLTQKQKRYFGFIAGGGVPKYQQSDVVGDVDPPDSSLYGSGYGQAPITTSQSDNLNLATTPNIIDITQSITTTGGPIPTDLPNFPLTDEEVEKRKQEMRFGDFSALELEELVNKYNFRGKPGRRRDWRERMSETDKDKTEDIKHYLNFNALSGKWKYLNKAERESFFKDNERLKDQLNFNDPVVTDLEKFYMDYAGDEELRTEMCPDGACLESSFKAYDRLVRNNPNIGLKNSYGLKEGLYSAKQDQLEARFKNYNYDSILKEKVLALSEQNRLAEVEYDKKYAIWKNDYITEPKEQGIPTINDIQQRYYDTKREIMRKWMQENPPPPDTIENATAFEVWEQAREEMYTKVNKNSPGYGTDPYTFLNEKGLDGENLYTNEEKEFYKKGKAQENKIWKAEREREKLFEKEWDELTNEATKDAVALFKDYEYTGIGPDNFSLDRETGKLKINVPYKGVSADSWQIHGALVTQGGKNIYNANVDNTLQRNTDGSWRYPKKVKKLFANMPVGTVLGFGHNENINSDDNFNAKMIPGMGRAGHSMVVAGFTEDGIPILYDHFMHDQITRPNIIDEDGNEEDRIFQQTMPYRDFNEVVYNTDNYDLVGITVPKGAQNATFANLSKKGLAQDLKTSYDTGYVEQLSDSLANGDLGRIVDIDIDSTEAFVGHLGEEKALLTHTLKMKDNEYNELANIAVALGINETEGGGGILSQPIFDQYGESQGFTQLKMSNIMGVHEEGDRMQSGKIAKGGEIKDEVLHSAYQKLNKEWRLTHNGKDLDIQDPGASAALTMLYLSEASKRAEKAFQKGLSGGTRTFWEPDLEQELKGYIRGGQGNWGNKGFLVEGAPGIKGERISTDAYLDRWEYNYSSHWSRIPTHLKFGNLVTSAKEKRENLQEKLNETYFKLNPGKTKPVYIVREEDGRTVIKKTTIGNNPNLTKAQKLDYYWQSGDNTLASGDAQGGATRGRFANKVVSAIKKLQIGDEETSIISEEKSFERGGKIKRYQSSGDIEPPINQQWVQEAGKTAPDGQTRYVGDDTYEQKYSLPPFTVEADRMSSSDKRFAQWGRENVAELARRKTTTQAAEENPMNQGFGVFNPDNWSRDNMAKTDITGKFRAFPNDPNSFIDNWINPGSAFIGPMADALAGAPKQARDQDSYWPYVTALGAPLLGGTLGGLGANTGPARFAAEMLNPIPGIDAGKLADKSIKYAKQGAESLMNSTQGRKLAGQLQNQAHVKNITGDVTGPSNVPRRDFLTEISTAEQSLRNAEERMERIIAMGVPETNPLYRDVKRVVKERKLGLRTLREEMAAGFIKDSSRHRNLPHGRDADPTHQTDYNAIQRERIKGTQAELDAEFKANALNPQTKPYDPYLDMDSDGIPIGKTDAEIDDFNIAKEQGNALEDEIWEQWQARESSYTPGLGSSAADADDMFGAPSDAERELLAQLSEDIFGNNPGQNYITRGGRDIDESIAALGSESLPDFNTLTNVPGISQNAKEINDLLKTDAIRNINKTPFNLRVSASPAPIRSIKDVNRAMGEGMQLFDEADNLLTAGQARNLINKGERVNGRNPFQNADELTNSRRLGAPANKLYMQLQNPKTKIWHDIGDHSYSPHVTSEGNFVGYKRKGHFPFTQLQGRHKQHPLWETIAPYNKAGVKGQSKDEMYKLLAKQLGKSVEEIRAQKLFIKHIGEKGSVLPLEGTGVAGTFQKAVLESMKRQGKGIYSDKAHTLSGIKQYLHQLKKGRVEPVGLDDKSTEMLNKALKILDKEDISKLSGKELSKLLPGVGIKGSAREAAREFEGLRQTRFKHIKNRGGEVRRYQQSGDVDPPQINYARQDNTYIPGFRDQYAGETQKDDYTNIPTIHDALYQASFLPVVGEAADATNAALYLKKRNYEDAAWSAAGLAIPFVGGAALKAGAKGVKKAYNSLLNKTDDFVSDIDWGKWHPETPTLNEGKLLKEYNYIEAITKKRGTWMKNADGSKFKGTPEQFVQQKSKNFNLAFSKVLREDGKVIPVIHQSKKKFDFFDESKNLSGTGANRYGEGVYAIPEPFFDKRIAHSFDDMMDETTPRDIFTMWGNNKYSLYANEVPGMNKVTYKNRIPVTKDTKYEDIYAVVSPYDNRLKSTIGNRGTFDMSDPNIDHAKGGPIRKQEQKGLSSRDINRLNYYFNLLNK